MGVNANYGIGVVIVVFIFEIAGFGIWLIQLYTYPPQILRFSQRAQGFAISQAVGCGFAITMSYTLSVSACFPRLAILRYQRVLELCHSNSHLIAICRDEGFVPLSILRACLYREPLLTDILKTSRSPEEMDVIFDGVVHFDIRRKDIPVVEGSDAGDTNIVSSDIEKQQSRNRN